MTRVLPALLLAVPACLGPWDPAWERSDSAPVTDTDSDTDTDVDTDTDADTDADTDTDTTPTGPRTERVTGSITGDTTWDEDAVWVLTQQVFVEGT